MFERINSLDNQDKEDDPQLSDKNDGYGNLSNFFNFRFEITNR